MAYTTREINAAAARVAALDAARARIDHESPEHVHAVGIAFAYMTDADWDYTHSEAAAHISGMIRDPDFRDAAILAEGLAIDEGFEDHECRAIIRALCGIIL